LEERKKKRKKEKRGKMENEEGEDKIHTSPPFPFSPFSFSSTYCREHERSSR
jgi:hypothetical protein